MFYSSLAAVVVVIAIASEGGGDGGGRRRILCVCVCIYSVALILQFAMRGKNKVFHPFIPRIVNSLRKSPSQMG